VEHVTVTATGRFVPPAGEITGVATCEGADREPPGVATVTAVPPIENTRTPSIQTEPSGRYVPSGARTR